MIAAPDPGSIQEAALDYARRGWAVFPLHCAKEGTCTCAKTECKSRGKHPRTAHGVKDATVDEASVRGWWTRWPDANIGIATGAASKLVVIDVDPRDGGSVEAIERTYGPLPSSPRAHTGGGGLHLLFAYPGVTIRNKTGLLPGIDVRGDGGYIVAPPSTHATGEAYRWDPVLAPDRVLLEPLPTRLCELLKPSARRAPHVAPLSDDAATCRWAGAALKSELREVAAAVEGTRNDTLNHASFALGQLVGSGALDRERVERELSHAAEACGLSALEAERTIASGIEAGIKEPRGPAERLIAAAPLSQRTPPSASANGEPPAAAWESPTPLDKRTIPSFPADILPPWLRDWVQQEAVATQTPVDLPGMLAFSVLSTACAGRLRVRVRAGFEEPLNTFGAVVLAPANRKSAVFRDATAPVMDLEREEIERQRESISQAAQRKHILELRLERAERDAARAYDEIERTMAAGDADSVRRELSGVHVPAEPRYYVDDVTPEKLTMMLAEQGGRMAQLTPEGDVFDMMAGRYSSSPNFTVYLKGHAGDTLRVDRAGRVADYVRDPALTLGLAVQPEVIRGLMARSDFRGRGLCGRFLYAFPKSPLGRREVGAPPVPESVRSAYVSGVRALFALPFDMDPQGAPAAHVLRFDAEADRFLVAFERELEPRLGPHGDLGWMNDWAGKLVGHLARVSGLLHMADAAGLSAPWEVPVSGECVRRAVTLGRYLIAHAQAAYGAMGADPDVAGADHLLGWLERSPRESFTKRDAHQENRGRFQHADDVGPALCLLEEHGYIRALADEQTEKRPGRKPSPTYEVNPLAFGDVHSSQNAHNTHNGPTDLHSEDCEESESVGRRILAPAPAGAAGSPS